MSLSTPHSTLHLTTHNFIKYSTNTVGRIHSLHHYSGDDHGPSGAQGPVAEAIRPTAPSVLMAMSRARPHQTALSPRRRLPSAITLIAAAEAAPITSAQ
jgi:hypothetical protein